MELKRKIGRKSLVVLLTLTMIFSMFSSVFAAGSSDIDGHWAEKQLKQWIDNGLLNGYGEGVYKPNQTLTRSEAAAFVNRAFEHEETTEVNFPDVESSDWFYNDVSKALAAGFMTGYEDGTFKPDQNITRQELAVMIFRLLDLEVKPEAVDSFDDAASIGEWAKGEIGALVDLGIVSGYNNKIQPEGLTTRAEAIVMIQRATEYLYTYSEAGTYGPEEGIDTILSNVTVTASGVTLQNLVIEGDLLLTEGIGEGDVHLNNVTVKGTTIISGGGENSIHLKDTVLVTVIVDKKNGKVRIVAEGKTDVKEVTLNSGAKLEESDIDGAGFADVILSTEIAKDANVELVGEFETVDVFAATVSIEIPEGAVESLNVDETAEGVALDLGKDATIVELVLDAVTEVLGEGTVETVEGEQAEESNVEVDTTPAAGGSGTSGGGDSTPPATSQAVINDAYVQVIDPEKTINRSGSSIDFILQGNPDPQDDLDDSDKLTTFILELEGAESLTLTRDGETETIDFYDGALTLPVSLLLGDRDSDKDGVRVDTIKEWPINYPSPFDTLSTDASVKYTNGDSTEVFSLKLTLGTTLNFESGIAFNSVSLGFGETFPALKSGDSYTFDIDNKYNDYKVLTFIIEADNAKKVNVTLPLLDVLDPPDAFKQYYFNADGIIAISVPELLGLDDAGSDGVSVGIIKDQIDSITGNIYDNSNVSKSVTLVIN
ncbi:S-layer homology domain-containing protein [Chengkuizengella sediminis]|uniref:S-layer homology domain-containing protein n=1 Tax=Chengkuizengella sediminis TaxID=1885917 RepID=UPI00138998F8|nr:S-layer homology domain-containing protein [Chengkuizengella sediminis]NDI35683.1 S-layer homology domain-containing protein [Chengkuizengella sediminis]